MTIIIDYSRTKYRPALLLTPAD